MAQANAVSDLERAEHQDGAKKVLAFGYDDAASQHVQLAVNSDGTLQTEDTPLSSPVTTNVTLTNADTDYKLPSSEKANRRTIIISNNSAYDVYLGQQGVIDADAATPIGIKLEPGATIEIACSSGLYAQSDTAGVSLTVTEF